MENDIWKRVYFDGGYNKPYLFYVLFGTDNMDNLLVSKSKHNIDGMPDELEIISYSKLNNEQQKEYIESLYDGYLGRYLKEKSGELYEKVVNSDNITVIKGEFDDNDSLNYLKNSIGIIQAVIDTNVVAVLDLQIFRWYEPEEWTKRYFEPKAPMSFDHVNILFSEEDGGIWLHTRGMRKFGRPDLSIRRVAPDKKELGLEIINRYIQAFAYGLKPDESKEIWIKGMEDGVYGKVLGDYDNPDFNNCYFEIEKI